jgi:hypothetical protein
MHARFFLQAKTTTFYQSNQAIQPRRVTNSFKWSRRRIFCAPLLHRMVKKRLAR